VRVPWEASLVNWQAFMTSQPNERGDGDSSPFPIVRYRGPAAIVGLSSSQPTPPFCAYGTLGDAQLQRLGPLLRRLGEEGRFRVVLLHHPPRLENVSRRRRLVDAEPFRRIIEDVGAELILHGHDHRFSRFAIDTARGPVPVIGVPSASATLDGEKPLAGFHVYRIGRAAAGWRIEVAVRVFDPASGRFAQADGYVV
jgi:3',5'-cyclic AMP phosphodiesterase CpdA